MKVRKSFNIKYDTGTSDILDGYYATSSHSNIIRNVLDGVLSGTQKAHIAYGPYGSGKSYISTILINILSKTYSNKELEALSLKFRNVDTEISARFLLSKKIHVKHLPVLLNGYEGDFETAILKALFRTLRQYNLNIYTKGIVSRINDIVLNWETNFPDTYKKFVDFLIEESLSKRDFFSKIEIDKGLLGKFGEFYKEITSGASFETDDESGLIDVLETILKELSKLNLGIFIVYDEFGRLLQSIKHNEVNRFMEQLQSIAELANTGAKNLTIQLIAHKPVSHYFMYLDRDARSEFSKIEKRYTVSEIKSDNNTFILITKEVIKSLRQFGIMEEQVIEQSRNLNKYRIFTSNMNDTEIENQIIRDCYPLHPVTLFSLPRISNIFGQNERTLFTFLRDESSYGLSGYIQNGDGYYYPDHLVDYFFSSVDNTELENIKDVAIYRKSLSQTKGYFDSATIETAYRILKFCFLWGITNSNGYVNLSLSFISFSLGLNQEIVDRILQVFIEKKILRVNAIKKYIEIIEASAVDLEIEISKRVAIQNMNMKIVNETLNKLNPVRYFYSTVYNNKNDITRFAEIELNILNHDYVDFEQNNHDILIRILVGSNDITVENTISNKLLHGYVKIDTIKQVVLIKRIAALNNLMLDRHFLAEYRNVELEINHEITLAQRKLDEFFKKIFGKDLVLANNSDNFKIKNIHQLSEVVDNLMSEVYSQQLIIHNDQINMFLISNIQEKSIIKVIDLVMRNGNIELDRFFDGNKPEYLVYFSMKNSNYQGVRSIIRDYIKEHENGSLFEIFDILKSSPFGIRPTLVSLVFIFSIFDMWKNIMFFNRENFIADLPAENLYQCGLGQTNYQYSYSNFEFENKGLIQKIVIDFGPLSESVANKSLTIKACSCLYNWYLSLPVTIQLGNNIGMRERYFTRSIEKAKTNPKNSIEQIVSLVGEEPSMLNEIKNDIESAFNKFIEELDEKLRISLGINTWYDWATSQNDVLKRSNDFVKICLIKNDVLREYAKAIEILEIERWPMAMFEVLRSNIENILAKMNNELSTLEISINGEVRHIYDVNLSNKALLLKSNVSNLIEANRKYITKAEVEKVVLEIVEKFLK